MNRWPPTKTWLDQTHLSSKHKAAAFHLGYLWKQTAYVCVGTHTVPTITNSQSHCEARKHYRRSINVKLGHADMVSLWQSQALTPVSWSPIINRSFCKQKIYQSNKTMKIKVSQFLVQHLPFCITLLNFLTEFTAQWKMSLPLTRLELSTAQFFTMSTFHCKKTVVWIVGLMKINVKFVSDFKEFRISSTVCAMLKAVKDWLLAETSKCCSNNE